MLHEFSRTEMLIGKEKLKCLRTSRILVLGIGGVGSHCVDALARSGAGTLIFIDHDRVSLTNINRQSIAFHHTIGQFKTSVLKQQIADINPNCRVITRETFILPENLNEVMQDLEKEIGGTPDYLIDAADTVSAKLALAEYAFFHHIPLISSMGTGNKLHPELFTFADIYQTSVCPLCRVMRRELKKRGIPSLLVLYSKEEPKIPKPSAEDVKEDEESEKEIKESSNRRIPPGSISFVPPVAGLMIAGEVIRRICNLS